MKNTLTKGLFVMMCLLLSNCAKPLLNGNSVALSSNEIVVARWSPDHVWIPKQQVYKDGKLVTVKGRYEYRPRYKSRWVAAHIRKTPRGKVWIDDRWE